MGKLKDVLSEFIDPIILNNLFIKDQDNEEYETQKNLDQILLKCQKRTSPCSKCPTIVNQNTGHQDLPGFVGAICYNEDSKIINKDIIIFGMEISTHNAIKKAYSNKEIYPVNLNWSNLHFWYEFGYLKGDNLNLLFDSAPLWNILDLFIPINKNLSRIYGTDIAKCFTLDKDVAYKNCQAFLINELNCFKDKDLIFILQGNSVFDHLGAYFEFEIDTNYEEFLKDNFNSLLNYNKSFKPKNARRYPIECGEFRTLDENIIKKKGKYLRIYHSSGHLYKPKNFNADNFWNKILRNSEKGIIKLMRKNISNYLKVL